MRGELAHITNPGPGAADGAPVGPTTPPSSPQRRPRGNSALAGLPSTTQFSSGRLSPAGRALVLFCLHCLVGDDGTLNDTYQRLIDRHGTQDKHWCAGLPLAKVRKTASYFLGKSATRTPDWPEIVELFAVALEPDQHEQLLAIAAGLFCQVKDLDRPPDYTGPIVMPDWARDEEVTAETVKKTIGDYTATPAAALPEDDDEAPAAKASAGESEPGDRLPASRDPDELWSMVKILGREGQVLLDAIAQLRERNHRLELDAKESWQLRSENARLIRLVQDLLSEQHYALTTEEVRQLLNERLGATRAHTPAPRAPRRRPGLRPPHLQERHLTAHPPA